MAGGRTKPSDRATEKGMRTAQRGLEAANIEVAQLKVDRVLHDTRIKAQDTKIKAAETSLLSKLQWTTVHASASATGTAGQIAYQSGFLYICVATDTWQRIAIATWT